MPDPPDAAESSLRELAEQVADLRDRVVALEHRLGLEARPAPVPGLPVTAPATLPPLPGTANLVPFIGVTLLGLAAAYLLRALSEMGILPLRAGVALGALYAFAWLVGAARTAPAKAGLTILRSLTSILILAPLLWEAQVRFQAIPSWATAAVLAIYSVFGLAISWRKDRAAIAWITTLAGLFALAALLIATLDLAPFIWALLAIALAVEVSACFDHWLNERWVVALITDLALVLIVYIATRAAGPPPGYAPFTAASVVAMLIALLAIYFAAAFARTLWRGRTITAFEIAQSILAFAIAATGALRVSAGHPAGALGVGLFSLACAAACYLISLAFFARDQAKQANFYTYATFGMALTAVGAWLLFHGTVLVAILSVLGVVFVHAGAQARRLALESHGLLYLVLASWSSGILAGVANRFVGVSPHAVSDAPRLAGWIAAAAAVAAAVLVMRPARPAEPRWNYRALSAALAGLAAFSIDDRIAGLVVAACPNTAPERAAADFCPTFHTLVLTLTAVATAWIARQRKRPELAWVVYLLMGMLTAKLMLQELRLGHTVATVVSLLLYGGTLVLLPRIWRRQ